MALCGVSGAQQVTETLHSKGLSNFLNPRNKKEEEA